MRDPRAVPGAGGRRDGDGDGDGVITSQYIGPFSASFSNLRIFSAFFFLSRAIRFWMSSGNSSEESDFGSEGCGFELDEELEELELELDEELEEREELELELDEVLAALG